MISFVKTNAKFLLCIFFCSLGMRILWAWSHPSIATTADSRIYYDMAQQLFTHPTLGVLINPWKTTGYPLFLMVLMRLNPYGSPPVDTTAFNNFLGYVVTVQSMAAILAPLMIFWLLLKLAFSPKTALIVSLFHGMNLMIIPWERVLLTDSFAASWFIFYTVITVLLIKHPRTIYLVAFLFLSVIGVFVRMALVTVPIITLLILLVRYLGHKQKYPILATLFLYLLFPIFFLHLNTVLHSYHGLQITSDINLLGKILEYDLPISQSGKDPYFVGIVSDYRQKGGEPQPYRLLDSYDPDIYVKPTRLVALRQFATSVIKDNVPIFMLKTIEKIPYTLFEIDPLIAVSPCNKNLLPCPLFLLQQTQRAVQTGLVVFLPLVFVSLVQMIRHASFKHTAVAYLGAISASQIVLSASLSYGEYGRLVMIVMPLLLLFAAYWVRHVLLVGIRSFNHN